MELLFLGRGAAFNPIEGNTSCYFIENNELFLIDCGETTFQKLIKNNILNNIKNIHIMITHTHSDHIGSLGTLISYSNKLLNIKPNIIISDNLLYLDDLKLLLKIVGIKKEEYNLIDISNYSNYDSFNSIEYEETKHSPKMHCYSIKFNTNKGIVYYSGDTKELDNIINIIHSNENIDKIYVDTSSSNNEDSKHVYIGGLKNEIPVSLRDRIYCMHINDNICRDLIEEYGFNIVRLI